MDDFWKVEYNNPNHSSMATDGGKITFWGKPQGNDFKGFICHEAGHILDGVSHVSSSKEWQDAVAADDKIYAKYLKGVHRISRYAKTNDSEDFAECMRYYITDHGYIKQHFPNRAAYIRRMAQNLSGHQPKFP